MPKAAPTSFKFALPSVLLGLLLLGFSCYFAACSLMQKPDQSQLFYARNSELLFRMSPDEVTVVASFADQTEFQFKRDSNITGIEISGKSKSLQSVIIFNQYTLNSSGGFDLLYRSDLFKYRGGMSENEQSAEEMITRLRKEVELLPNDFPKANNMILPVPNEPEVERALSFFKAKNFSKAFELHEKLIKKYPNDLFLNILKLDLLSKSGKQEELKTALSTFEKTFPTNGEDLVDYTIKVHEFSLVALESIKQGNNAFERLPDLGGNTVVSETELEHGYIDYDKIPNFTKQGLSVLFTDSVVPNFLTIQTFAKLNQVKGNLLLISLKPNLLKPLG